MNSQRHKKIINLDSIGIIQLKAYRNTLLNILENLSNIMHISLDMHQIFTKHKVKILAILILAVSLAVTIAISWNSFMPRSHENIKVDTYINLTKTEALKSDLSVNELEAKQAELKKLNTQSNKLELILAEKQGIYNRLLELQNEPYTYEVAQLETRNEQLTQYIISEYPELWDEK